METDKKIETPQDNIDKENSTFKEIVFKDIEPCRPTSWEEYCEINKRNLSYEFSPTTIEGCYNLFYTKERAKQFVALGKILQLRDYWVKDYEFEDAIRIDVCKDGVIVTRKCDINDGNDIHVVPVIVKNIPRNYIYVNIYSRFEMRVHIQD